MDKVSGRLTVFFEEPFWIGVFERISEGKLSVCKVTFGAEPKEYEIYDFVHLLCAETQSSGFVNLGDAINYRKNGTDDNLCALHHDIGIEHGNGYWYPNKYI